MWLVTRSTKKFAKVCKSLNNQFSDFNCKYFAHGKFE